MNLFTKEQHRGLIKEAATFALVLSFCVSFCFFVNDMMPAQKRAIDYLVQGLFSTLLAVPTGAAWRSLRHAWSSKR